MADNIIKVNVTSNKQQRVTVSSAQVGTEITASSDTGKFWAQNSKNWAVSENIVDGVDYSSKHYANVSKQNAQNSQSYAEAAQDTYNAFQSQAGEAVEELQTTKTSSIEEITTAKDEAVNNINSTKTTILNDIEFVADGEKEEIRDLANDIKEGAEDIINRVSLSMFDTILKDHVLTYEESKGLALQGTYVYKNAVAGERYGYPDFYNKVVEEYHNSTLYAEEWTQPIITANTTTTTAGNIVCTASSQYSDAYGAWKALDGILSGSDAWASVTAETKGWWQVKFPYKLKITGLTFYSSHGTSNNYLSKDCQFFTSADMTTPIGNAFVGSTVAFTPTQITGIPAEGVITDTIYLNITSSNSSGIGMGGLQITAEKVVVEGLKRNDNGHLFYDIAEKDKVDEYFNINGSAWFYGVDTENERVFLPRNNYFEQATGDGLEVGQSVEAGLPNITGGFQGDLLAPVGAFYGNGTVSGNATAGGDGNSDTQFKFDASRSNPIYGNSDTVQPPAVKKLLYICVGNTISDTSWVDAVTQVEGGVKDLEDKTQEGLNKLNTTTNNSIADINTTAKSHSVLTYKNITNCLLEVPQRIKYELVDGTLTLKAGSVVIVPYGVEDLRAQYPKGATFIHENFKIYDTQFADGKFFVWAEVQNDIAKYSDATDSKVRPIILNLTGNSFTTYVNTISSDSQYTGTENNVTYRTDLNIVQRSPKGVLEDAVVSFPFLRVASNSTILYSQVQQVFNGMGYIGSTVWVDKGVKGLAPNGRNTDGTLKNYEITTTQVSTYTRNLSKDIPLWLNTNGTLFLSAGIVYDEKRNVIYSKDAENQTTIRCQVAMTNLTNGVVNSFNPKQPFQSADYNQIDGRWVGKELEITSSMSSATYDLSSYLPNDGFDYEVMIAVRTYAGSDGNESYFAVYSDIIPRTLAWLNCWGNNASRQNADVFTLPVSASRKIYTYAVSMASGQVFAIGYRRLGMNM